MDTPSSVSDKLFIDAMGVGASPKEAAQLLGYAEDCADVEGRKLKERLQSQIVDAQIAYLQNSFTKALTWIHKLAVTVSKKSETPEGNPSGDDTIEKKTTEEIEQELCALIKEGKLDSQVLDTLLSKVPLTDRVPPGFGPDPAVEEEMP
jgi:hypothetical protein